MQFSLKLVKITAYARPRKQKVPHYKTSSGTPQRNTSAWEINLFKYSVNFLSAYFHIYMGRSVTSQTQSGKPVLPITETKS